MRKAMSLLVPIIMLALGDTACVAQADALEERLSKPLPAHPRLLLGPEGFAGVRAKVTQDAGLAKVWEFIHAAADHMLDEPVVERELEGKRLLGVSRTCLQRVVNLAFTYGMTGETKYLRRAEQEMLAAAAFTDWNPKHFLDVAEMTAALAIGYDWLHGDLSAEARATFRDAILTKGLGASFPNPSWVTTTNNWNQVCHGGMVLGALATFEDDSGRAEKVIRRALENLPRAMQEYEPDGVYPEGPSYWAYGTTYNVLIIAALESALGSDFGVASGALMKSPWFMLQATAPTGRYFNFADCGLSGGLSPAMYWFANRLKEPSLLWHEQHDLAALDPEKARAGKASPDRFLPCLILWAGPTGSAPEPTLGSWHGDGHSPIAVLRSGWNKDDVYLGLKGGSPGTNHGHMDIGSFVLERDGVRWAIDLGMQGYYSLESKGVDLWNRKQDSERWSVFRINNLSHNTLVVDGQHQVVSGNAPITEFKSRAKRARASVDMSSVYAGQLKSALRTASLKGRTVKIEDELTAPDNDVVVRWGMATNATVSLEGTGVAVLRQDDKELTLRVVAPDTAKIEIIDMETPPASYDAKNENTRMVAFSVPVKANKRTELRISLE